MLYLIIDPSSRTRMGLVHHFIETHKEMFVPQKAHHVHPHDHFMEVVFLRFIPRHVTPNQITMFRIVATPFVFALTLYQFYIPGIIAFLLVAATDALDGSLARTRNQITEFGMMFDPLADKLLIGSMILLVVFQNYNFWLGVAVLGLEIAFIASAAIAKIKFHSVHMANLWGKLKMISQVIAVFLTLAALLLQAPQLIVVGTWVFGVAIGFALMSLFAHGI